MKMKAILSLLLVLLPMTAVAVKVSSLYQAEIPVLSQSSDERTVAVRQALLEVLIKVSGDQDIENKPIIKEGLRKAAYYVQEFSYGAPTTLSSHYLLQIRFVKEDINKLLQKANLTYWGENRPLTLVWLTVTDAEKQPEIIGNESLGNLLTDMRRAGKKYGVPFIFPVMDVEDINKISVDDINSRAISALKNASKRYTADALLIGNITPTDDGGYQSQWQLLLNDTRWEWTYSSKTFTEIISLVTNQINQTYTNYYKVKEQSDQSLLVKLDVTRINRREDLNQLMHYLNQLSLVQQIQLLQISGDKVTLSVLIHGSINTFQQNATIGQYLSLKSQDLANNQLTYEWTH